VYNLVCKRWAFQRTRCPRFCKSTYFVFFKTLTFFFFFTFSCGNYQISQERWKKIVWVFTLRNAWGVRHSWVKALLCSFPLCPTQVSNYFRMWVLVLGSTHFGGLEPLVSISVPVNRKLNQNQIWFLELVKKIEITIYSCLEPEPRKENSETTESIFEKTKLELRSKWRLTEK